MSRHVLDDVDQFKKEHRELKHADGWFYCQCETARRLRQLYQYHDIIRLRLERAKKRKGLRSMRKEAPPHPYWCDDCGMKAGFTIPGCPIPHAEDCPRHGEDPMDAYRTAKAYCIETGNVIE